MTVTSRRQIRSGMESPVIRASRWQHHLNRLRNRYHQKVVPGLRAATAPALAHLRDHYLTITAFSCFVWAAALWNAKAGLITAGILLVLFELKVGD